MVISNVYQSAPKDWTLEGSQDGTNWTIIDTRVNQPQISNSTTYRDYGISNTVAYRFYKINITATGGRSILISEMELIANSDYDLIDEGLKVDNGEVTISGAYTLPTTDGSVGQVMTANGSGSTSWTTISTADNLGNHSATQNIALNDNELRLRAASDGNHALRMMTTSSPFATLTTDGPALYGYAGGVLGTTNGGEKAALQWNNSGNVGIGTSSPSANSRLSVNANTNWIATDIGSSSGDRVVIGNLNGKATIGGHNADFTAWANLTLNSGGGYVGIREANPQYPLHVSGFANRYIGNHGYLNSSGTAAYAGDPVRNISIYADNFIAAQEFVAFSDERIKNIQGRSDSRQDLQTLMSIEVTDYTLKDSIEKGNKPYKKVIAQQLKEVYPQAVLDNITEVVPDIYQIIGDNKRLHQPAN